MALGEAAASIAAPPLVACCKHEVQQLSCHERIISKTVRAERVYGLHSQHKIGACSPELPHLLLRFALRVPAYRASGDIAEPFGVFQGRRAIALLQYPSQQVPHEGSDL